MKKLWNKIVREVKYFFNAREVLFQEAYAKEKQFWNDGALPEEVYRSQYDLRQMFESSCMFGSAFELGNPFRVHQIREEELRVKPRNTIATSMSVMITSVEEFQKFFDMLNDRIGEKGTLSIHVNGHLFIFVKWEGTVRILHSNRVDFTKFLVDKDWQMNKTFFRGESA